MTIQVITHNTTVVNATPDTQYTGIEDTHITSDTPTSNLNNAATFLINDSSNNALIKPDLTNLPADQTIDSALLYVYLESGFQGTPWDLYVHRCLRTVVFAEATWNIYSTGNNWGTAGGENTTSDHTATQIGLVEVPNTAGYYAVDITTWVQDVYDATITNQGLWLTRGDGSGSAYRTFTTKEGSDGHRPELVITHSASGGPSIPILTHHIRQQS